MKKLMRIYLSGTVIDLPFDDSNHEAILDYKNITAAMVNAVEGKKDVLVGTNFAVRGDMINAVRIMDDFPRDSNENYKKEVLDILRKVVKNESEGDQWKEDR